MAHILTTINSFVSLLLFAHPHVFIDNRVSAIFDNKGLTGFKHEWIFDEIFSSTIIQEFDLDLNNKFNDQEIKAVEKGAFSNLKEHNYFTKISINGERYKIEEFANFHASIDSGVMIYEFFLPCEITAISVMQEVTIAVYDPTYFVQILWEPHNPYAFEDTSKVKLSCEFIEDEKNAYYYGQIIPKALKIDFRKNNEKKSSSN